MLLQVVEEICAQGGSGSRATRANRPGELVSGQPRRVRSQLA
jgi:hypothetical protein